MSPKKGRATAALKGCITSLDLVMACHPSRPAQQPHAVNSTEATELASAKQIDVQALLMQLVMIARAICGCRWGLQCMC